MIPEDEDFDGTFPFKPHFCEAAGFRQHYVDEGEGAPIICLHGEPTWGYLYRNFIPPLSQTHRVIVPDHMGFGKSETPQDKEYTLRTHTENLTALINHLELTDITFVAQDWGGPICGSYTVRHPERVKRICLMNAVLPGVGLQPQTPNPLDTPWFQWIGKLHEAGTLHEILGNLGSTILSVMKTNGFQNSSIVNQTWIRAYSAPFPDKASCIGAIEFPLDAYLGRIREYMIEGFSGIEALTKKSAMLVFGLEDHAIDPDYAIGGFKMLYPSAPVVTLPHVGHFCQEDAPQTLIALIQQFIQITDQQR